MQSLGCLKMTRCLVSGETLATSTMPDTMTLSVLDLPPTLMNGLVSWHPIAVDTALPRTIINCGSVRGTRLAVKWLSSIGRPPRRSLVLQVAFGVSLLVASYLSFGMTMALFAALLLIYPTLKAFELLGVLKISMFGTQVSCSPTKMIKFTMFTGEMAVGRRKKSSSTSVSREMGSFQYYLAATTVRFTCCMDGLMITKIGCVEYRTAPFMRFTSTA
mmetsp:Transcript_2966/g.4233  ORF Transcript_2966/g.4233 Transcript_2966/m.4233 type:complete len:217 (+) Transcript_2966:264-914(+)